MPVCSGHYIDGYLYALKELAYLAVASSVLIVLVQDLSGNCYTEILFLSDCLYFLGQ